ncbi:hypothetical protein SKAU_G00220770 [Synaphobranchus kaupii]|uniref:Uncharacterized protein n=1 Tax=Synaphobranchus kaupii TaxID=118154 RepID=A0A9Q1ITU2_SYNKA|nr:hypothetical protein SKAU_G00220770 [Synaphobranchus kaupii]
MHWFRVTGSAVFVTTGICGEALPKAVLPKQLLLCVLGHKLHPTLHSEPNQAPVYHGRGLMGKNERFLWKAQLFSSEREAGSVDFSLPRVSVNQFNGIPKRMAKTDGSPGTCDSVEDACCTGIEDFFKTTHFRER